MSLDHVPVVDYDKHPAFSADAGRRRPNAETETLVAEIEADVRAALNL